jgi:hypothetical protein
MIYFAGGTLWAWSSPVGNIARVFLTIDQIPPNHNVYATCALTSVSQAVAIDSNRNETPGQISVGIKRWAVFNKDGGVDTIEPEASPEGWRINNSFIENCASVTFQLATSGAAGIASAAVYLDP